MKRIGKKLQIHNLIYFIPVAKALVLPSETHFPNIMTRNIIEVQSGTVIQVQTYLLIQLRASSGDLSVQKY